MAAIKQNRQTGPLQDRRLEVMLSKDRRKAISDGSRALTQAYGERFSQARIIRGLVDRYLPEFIREQLALAKGESNHAQE